jgi:hypothetical protein
MLQEPVGVEMVARPVETIRNDTDADDARTKALASQKNRMIVLQFLSTLPDGFHAIPLPSPLYTISVSRCCRQLRPTPP